YSHFPGSFPRACDCGWPDQASLPGIGTHDNGRKHVKKSIYAVATGAIFALGLAACGAPPEGGDDPAPEDTQETDDGGEGDSPEAEGVDFTACMVSDEGGFDDASFNESGFNGLKKAEDELGVEIHSAESNDPSDYDSNVDSQVQAGCDLIIGVGFALKETIAATAEATAERDYALVDEQIADPIDTERPVAPCAAARPEVYYARVDAQSGGTIDNALPLVFDTQGATSLAGYLAAGMTETGTGASYAGQLFPSLTIFMDGSVDIVD